MRMACGCLRHRVATVTDDKQMERLAGLRTGRLRSAGPPELAPAGSPAGQSAHYLSLAQVATGLGLSARPASRARDCMTIAGRKRRRRAGNMPRAVRG